MQFSPPATLVTAEHMWPMPTSLDEALLAPGDPAEQLEVRATLADYNLVGDASCLPMACQHDLSIMG